MSSVTVTENYRSKNKIVSLPRIDSDDVLSFLKDNSYVEETLTLKSVGIMNEVEKRLQKIEKDVVPIKKNFSIFGWGYLFQKRERIYPILVGIDTKKELKQFLDNNRYSYTPDIEKLRSYQFVNPQLSNSVIDVLKDSNDKIEFFRRSYNRVVKDDNEQYNEEKRINTLIAKGDTSTLMNSSAIFVNKKVRTLRKFFNDVGNTTLYNENVSAYDYFTNVNSMYKFFHFTMGSVVYSSAKTRIVSAIITSMGVSGGSAILASLPIYMAFSAHNIYQTMKEDNGETSWDKIMYMLWKAPLVGCMDCVKDMAATHLSLGRGFIISASFIFDVTMMFIDPRLSKQRSDDLAKTYGQGIDKETIKNLMEPTKESLIVSRILSKVMLPLDWIANIPEAVFTTIYSNVSSVLQYSGPLKYLFPLVSPAMYLTKKVASVCNITWKFGVYSISAIFCIVSCYNSFINVMPYFKEFFQLFINSDMSETGYGQPSKETLESMIDRLTEVTPSSWDKIHQTIIRNISGIGALESVIATMLNYIKITTKNVITYEFTKKVFLNLYKDKNIAKFFMGIPANWITSKTTTFLKSHTQMYLSVLAPTLLSIYSSRSGKITSLDQYLDVLGSSIVYGVAGFSVGVLLNIVWDNMLDHSKNNKIVSKYREIDIKANSMSGRWLSKRAAKHILYTYHYLSSNIIVDWIDTTVNKLKNKVAGNLIEWVEVSYGRKSFIYDSNFTWLSNRLVMDEYFSQAMNSAMIDVLSNVDTIMDMEKNSNIYKGVKLDKDKIKKVIDERKQMDLENKLKEINNQEILLNQKGGLESSYGGIKSKLESVLSRIDRVNRKISIDKNIEDLLEKRRVLLVEKYKMENNLQIISKALDDTISKIELSQSKVHQIDYIQEYYKRNESLWDNPTEMVNENATKQTASIVLNKFIPFISQKFDNTMLAALESDARTQYNIVHNRMKEYIENLSLLEESSRNILYNLPEGSSEKLENINSKYDDLVQRFNKDEGLHNHIEYMQAINEIVIKQQSLEMALNGYDIASFYQSNKRLSSIKKTQDVFLNDNVSRFSEKYIVQPSVIEKVKFGERDIATQSGLEIDVLLEEYRVNRGLKKDAVLIEEGGWFSSIYNRFENCAVEQIRKGMKNIVGYGMMKKKETIKRLQELKTIEENLKQNTAQDNFLQQIKNFREEELRVLSTVNKLVFNEIVRIKILIPEMKPVTDEDKMFVNTFSNLSYQSFLEHKREKDTDISTDIGIDKSTDYDYDIIYEKAFGGNQSPFSYTGEELQELQTFDRIVNLTSGVKVISDAFRLFEYECPDPPQTSCLNRNLFVKSIPQEVIKEFDTITGEIYEKISNLEIQGTVNEKKNIIASNMILMWITPEYRDRLSKFKVSQDSQNLLKTVMSENGGNSGGRMFNEYLKGRDIDWSNPHILYLLSRKMYHMDYASKILLNSNLKEYIKKEEDLLSKKDILFEDEVKQYEKLHQMTDEYNKNNGDVFTGIKARNEPSISETWAETIPNYIFNFVGSIFGSIGARGITNGIDWIRVQINKTRENREKDIIKEQYLSKLDNVENLIVKDNIKTQIDTWYSSASKVDSITNQIKYEKNLINLNYQTEDKSLRYIQRNLEVPDMSGILSPSEDEILHMFFADDESGLKRKYVTSTGLSFPSRVLDIERTVRTLKELK